MRVGGDASEQGQSRASPGCCCLSLMNRIGMAMAAIAVAAAAAVGGAGDAGAAHLSSWRCDGDDVPRKKSRGKVTAGVGCCTMMTMKGISAAAAAADGAGCC